jgi:hypothetical protein
MWIRSYITKITKRGVAGISQVGQMFVRMAEGIDWDEWGIYYATKKEKVCHKKKSGSDTSGWPVVE